MAKKPAKKAAPKPSTPAAPAPKLVPTVTIGGAPAGYRPQTLQPTVTIGGAPAGYRPTPTSVVAPTPAPDLGPIPYGETVPNFTPPSMPEPAASPAGPPVVVQPPVNTGQDSNMIDAFAMLEAQLRQWGLDSLASTFISLATQGFKPQEAMNKIKYDTSVNPSTGKPWNADYTKRFAGNAARVKQGLNAYTEAEYLALEDSYADTLRRNNLTPLISMDTASNQAQFAGYMEKGLSATEFAERIDEVSERIIYGSPEIKQQFREYFPALTDADIISYVLRPDITMPVLKTKITAAEIGGAARQVGLAATSRDMAETLAQAGVTRSEAQTGYESIGTFLSDAELYSKIYSQEGITYNQQEAEKDILLGQAEAGKKRKRLASMARASFEGSSGRARTGRASGNTGQF